MEITIHLKIYISIQKDLEQHINEDVTDIHVSENDKYQLTNHIHGIFNNTGNFKNMNVGVMC